MKNKGYFLVDILTKEKDRPPPPQLDKRISKYGSKQQVP